MKIDPVFLIAPKPRPPSMPTRRAFVLCGATFAFGAVVGGACGYSLGAAANAQPDEELEPSGDAELDELRRLAVKAPIEELIEKRIDFLYAIGKDYRRDAVLWRGIERLCDAVTTRASFPGRALTARLLAQTIDFSEPEFRSRFAERIGPLRQIK